MAAQQITTSRSEYLKSRIPLLEREKELTRLRDSLSKERRNLPLLEVTRPYDLTSTDGKKVNLSDLFAGRSQLIIYHAMFDPEWEQACPSCSLLLDHIPPLQHLWSRDTSFAVVSRAPASKIAAYQKKMGWDRFQWLSSEGTDFNYDFHVTMDDNVTPVEYNFTSKDVLLNEKKMPWFTRGEQPGTSVFLCGGVNGVGEEGKVYHSYSAYARAGEWMVGTFWMLDLTPLGRQDGKLENADGLGFRRRPDYKPEEIGLKA